jgi:hypothetical protein
MVRCCLTGVKIQVDHAYILDPTTAHRGQTSATGIQGSFEKEDHSHPN